jgi:anti-sigma factor RsiW
MNRQADGALAAETLAYVDNCLPQKHRQAFEARMGGDPAIRAQAARWQAQSEAIRAAFRDAPTTRAPVAGRGFSTSAPMADWAPQSIRMLRDAKAADRRQISGNRATESLAKARPTPLPQESAVRFQFRWSAARRILLMLVATLALWTSGAFFFSGEPSKAFIAAAAGAYRTFARGAAHPVEITTADAGVMSKWLGAQIARPLPIPDLSPVGLTLVGGRVVPGANAPASFAIYENARRERIGLYEEALDSPATTNVVVRTCEDMVCASWTADGRGYVLVGRASTTGIADFARLAAAGQPKI